MKSKRKIFLIVVAVVVAISIISMKNYLFIGVGNSTMNKVYNDNSKIADVFDTFGIDESKQTIESGSYKGKLKLSGSLTVWSYESSEDIELEVPYTFSVKGGKAKIVLISPDNTVTTLIENTDKATVDGQTTLTVQIKKGINRIKLVGYKKSEIDVELHIDKGTFQAQ